MEESCGRFTTQCYRLLGLPNLLTKLGGPYKISHSTEQKHVQLVTSRRGPPTPMTSKGLFRLCFIAFIVTCSMACYADSQGDFWTQYILKCNPNALSNKQDFYLGSTNAIIPGSVWARRGGTVNLIAESSAYFGTMSAATAALTAHQTEANCSGAGNQTWDLKLGVPVDLTGIGSADLTAAMNQARTIQIQIAKTWVQAVPIAAWEDAANAAAEKVKCGNAEYRDAVNGTGFLMNAAVAIDGLTVTYTLKSALSADLQANFSAGKMVTVGSTSNPLQANVTVTNGGTTVTLAMTGTAYPLGRFLRINRVWVHDYAKSQ